MGEDALFFVTHTTSGVLSGNKFKHAEYSFNVYWVQGVN